MTNDIRDSLLPITPSMERFTTQARAYDDFLDMVPRKHLPDTLTIGVDRLRAGSPASATFYTMLAEWMDTNAYDELGNYADLMRLAAYEKARRAL